MKKGLSKICWGESEKDENDYSSSPSKSHQASNLPKATKLRTFHWPPSLEPSIGHQVGVFPCFLPSLSL
jgi:hypothetical protein